MKKNYIRLREGWLFLLLFISVFAFGQQTFVDETPGTNKEWLIPAAVNSITVEMWGAGGGGAGSNGSITGGGGGGGGYSSKTIPVIPGQKFIYSVGTGGAGGNGSGTAGGTTTLNHADTETYMSASGGGGGGQRNGFGGAGGTASGGNINTSGISGVNSGKGGSSPSGGNGGGVGNSSPGANGGVPGGGGGGGNAGGWLWYTNYNGGNGGDGGVKLTYTPTGTYKASITAVNTGALTWCAGENRKVSVTIKNTGTLPWTNGPGVFNIGVKWNTNGNSWNDYNVRVPAENLAVNASKTYTLEIKASNNLNETVSPTPGYTTPLAAGSNNLTFDVVYEGVAWFAWNINGVGPGNAKYTTVNQTISAVPNAPASALPGTPLRVCSGASVNLSAISAGNSIVWYTSATGGNSVGTSASGANFSVVPPVGTTTYYAESKNTNGCASSSRTATSAITVNSIPSAPGFITGSANQCAGNTSQTYSIAAVANATGYAWTVPAGWSITGGQNTPSITVTVGTNGGNISVNAVNSCGTGYASGEGNGYKFITVSPPTVAGTLTPASTVVCGTTNSTNLNLNGNVGAIVRWESSLDNFSGGTITAIANTGSPYTAQNVAVDTYYRAVVQSGGCAMMYSNVVKITVIGNVATPGFISGSAAQCAGNISQIYSIAPVTNATSYVWSVGPDWIITNGQGTNSITVTVGEGNFNVSVKPNNSCSIGYPNGQGNGEKYVTVSPRTVGGTITPVSATLCSGSSTNISLSGQRGAILRWESSLDNFGGGTVTTIASTGSPITTPALLTDTYFRAVVQSGGCNLMYSNVVKITVVGKVGNSGPITGSATPCAGSTQVFSVTPVADATDYTWTVDTASGWTVLSGQGTNSITVKIGTNSANVSVIARNSCSISEGRYLWIAVTPSSPVSVNIAANPGISVCAGSPVTFTATPTNGGTAPSYQWKVNGSNVGSNSSTFTATTLANGDTVTAVLTSNATSCSSGSPAISNQLVMIISPKSVEGTVSGSQNICSGSPATISVSGNTGKIQWQQSASSTSGWTDISGANSASYTASNLTATTYYRAVVTSGNCGSATSGVITVTVNPLPSVPTAGAIILPTCVVSTGSVTLTGLPSTGKIVQTGSSSASYAITGGGQQTINDLAPGTYRFAVSNDCSISPSVEIVITVPVTNTWNGSSWSTGAAPTVAQTIKFTQSFTSTENLSACSCIINSGNVIIRSGHTLALTDRLEVNEAGTFTLEDKAILLQENKDAVNKGEINVERKVTGLRNEPGKAVDYVYWGSPVEGQRTKGAGGFSPGTPNANFFFYNEANDRFYETGDVTFTPGRGYAVRAETIKNPTTGSPYTQYDKTYKFTGKVNNGTIERNIIRSPDNPAGVVHGYNLVGNPYPSNIDFNELYLANCVGSDCLIYNTAWFWTNNVYTANQMGSGYSGNNYAIFNGTGGVSATSPYNGGLTPNGMIGVGQAFIVQKKAVGTGTLQFKNSNGVGRNIRVSSPATFFQKENGDRNKFWLKLISPTQLVNSQLIGYVAGATDGYEQDFDAEAFGDFSDLFYSVLGNKKMVIQGRNEDFSADDKVDLGAIFFQNGVYTIEVGETEGIFAGAQKIYLKDKQSNIITDLSQGSYSFVATKGNNATRFEILYKPETVLATESSVKEAVVVYRSGNDFVVKSSQNKITGIELYDTTGRLIYKKSLNGLTVVIPAEELVNTVYILKIDRSGEITTKKILR